MVTCHTGKGRRWPCWVLGLVMMAVVGCQQAPEAPVLLGFEPQKPTVHAGDSMYLRVTYDQKQARLYDFIWTVEAGTIRGNGLSAIAYEAPDTPGAYRIAVTLTYGRTQNTVSLDGTVTVLPAPPPAAISTPVAQAPEPPPVAVAKAPAEAPATSTPGTARASVVETLVQHGRFTAAVSMNFSPFSFIDADGQRVGFDIDLMHEFARRWVGDAKAVTLVPVLGNRRLSILTEGQADIVAAALTKTPTRQQVIDFSHTYFKDGQRLLVRAGSDIVDVCDLKGKKVAVTRGSTAIDNVRARARECGFAVDLMLVDAHDSAIEAVLKGDADAFSSDGLALEHFARGKPLQVVGNHFSDEPYGLGVPKGDTRFLRLVNLTLEAMAADGTFAAIYVKWFQDTIRPYPMPALATDTADPVLLKLATTDLPPLFPPVPKPASAPREYIVQKGDTLSRIAGKIYGDVSPASWKRIYEANREVIGPDPSRIRIGMRLTLPEP
jgi:ABC-type amino acid transport substrate-binding protein